MSSRQDCQSESGGSSGGLLHWLVLLSSFDDVDCQIIQLEEPIKLFLKRFALMIGVRCYLVAEASLVETVRQDTIASPDNFKEVVRAQLDSAHKAVQDDPLGVYLNGLVPDYWHQQENRDCECYTRTEQRHGHPALNPHTSHTNTTYQTEPSKDGDERPFWMVFHLWLVFLAERLKSAGQNNKQVNR